MVYSRVILRFLPEFSPLIKHGNRQRKPFSFISFTMEKKNNSKSIGDFCSALNCTKCRNKGNQGIVFLAIPMEGSRKVIIIDNISLELRKLLCYDADFFFFFVLMPTINWLIIMAVCSLLSILSVPS